MMMNRPKIGYKAVIVYGAFKWVILEMEIPDDASLVNTGDGFYRTDTVIPRKFHTPFIDVGAVDDIQFKSAHSWFRDEFDYTLNQRTTSTINLRSRDDCAAGIHFVTSIEQAKCWGIANFGVTAALKKP
jgi:hypothetical protein